MVCDISLKVILLCAGCACGARIQSESVNPKYYSTDGIRYERYERMYTHHGAVDITSHSGASTGLSVQQCLDQCDENQDCDCVTFEPDGGKCWLRKECNPPGFAEKSHTDVYVKESSEPDEPDSDDDAVSSSGVKYEKHLHKNAFSGHGAVDITAHSGENTGLTVTECIDECEDNQDCECVTFEPANGGCWLRKACNADFFQDRDKYNTYTKP